MDVNEAQYKKMTEQPLSDVITFFICIPFTIGFFRELVRKEQEV